MGALYSTTPNPVDPFSRYMAELFDEKQIIGVPTAFQQFFGNPANGSQTLFSPNANAVDIDIIRGNEKVAALIHRGQNSRDLGTIQKNVNVEKFTNFSRKYPLAEEEGDITGDQITFRSAGESPYQKRTRLDRMRNLAQKIHLENARRIVRLFETLCVDSILNGQQVALSGTTDSDLIYDFRRNSSLTVTPTNTWNSGSQNIMGDIDGMCDNLRALGHVSADMMIQGGQAMDAFIKDTDIQSLADNRRFELIQVSTNNPVPDKFRRFIDGGLTARGRLRTAKGHELWMFTYNDLYTNTAGTAVKYMPEDEALICYSGARADRYFGPPERIPTTAAEMAEFQDLFGFSMISPPMPPNVKGMGSAVNPAMFYTDAYIANDRKKVTVRTQAAPIFATTQTDAFGLLQGLIT
jgi:hypothetical protein